MDLLSDSYGMRSLALISFGVATLLLVGLVLVLRSRGKTTKLTGPCCPNWLFGVLGDIHRDDSGVLYEKWADRYGAAYCIPGALGSQRIVLFDPKAISHFFAKDTYGYVHQENRRRQIEQLAGRSLFWAEGDKHKRQRRVLTPFFSGSALRGYMPSFYDAAYKLKTSWDTAIGSSQNAEIVIDVQDWFDRVTLDVIGNTGFEHEFGSLDGHESDVAKFFEFLGTAKDTKLETLLMLLSTVLPSLQALPVKRTLLTQKLNDSMGRVAKKLMVRTHKEMAFGQFVSSHKSIVGALLKAEMAAANGLSEKEVSAQIRLLILAGYETSSIVLTWIVIELARNPEKQDRLREELLKFTGSDPTYDDFQSGLQYLDSVIQETLRLHPPLTETFRIAAEDDIIPLSTSVVTAAGEVTNNICVARGTPVVVPIQAIGCSETIWGPTAREFIPERWLDNKSGLPGKAKEIQGYRHILSFADGPRICLGKQFAFAEIKAVLFVVFRNYAIDLRDGTGTKLEMFTTVLPSGGLISDCPWIMMLISFETPN